MPGHFSNPLVSTMEVSKGPVKEFWGNANVITLQEDTSLKDQLIPGNPEVLSNPQDQPEVDGQPPEGEPVQGTADWVTFNGSSDSIQLMVDICICWMF